VLWLTTVHPACAGQVLPIAGIGISGFGRKGALFPFSDIHKSLQLSNPEKWGRFIHILNCQKHGLDCTDGKKCGFTMPKAWLCHKYREAAALLLNSQLQGN